MKLGCQCKSHKGRAAIRHYAIRHYASRRFQPGEGPSRGLIRDCTISPINQFAALVGWTIRSKNSGGAVAGDRSGGHPSSLHYLTCIHGDTAGRHNNTYLRHISTVSIHHYSFVLHVDLKLSMKFYNKTRTSQA